MRHAIFIPPFDELADPRVVRDVAIAAEELGWDAVFVWDHVLRPETEVVGDAMVSLAAVAAATSRIRLGAMVTPITRRRPTRFARETVALDHLSAGRLIVGLGLGVDSGGELSRFGEIADPVVRGARLEEGARLLLALWSGEWVDFAGDHFVADDVRFLPRPVQFPHPPLWFAVRQGAPRPMRRAARLGDGIHAIETDPDGVRAMIEAVEGERGSLAGFDIACPVEPGTAGEEWAGCGVTWAMHSFAAVTPLADVMRVVGAGPPS